MIETCFIFASKAEKTSDSIIKKYIPDSIENYDIHFLCSDNKEKILNLLVYLGVLYRVYANFDPIPDQKGKILLKF